MKRSKFIKIGVLAGFGIPAIIKAISKPRPTNDLPGISGEAFAITLKDDWFGPVRATWFNDGVPQENIDAAVRTLQHSKYIGGVDFYDTVGDTPSVKICSVRPDDKGNIVAIYHGRPQNTDNASRIVGTMRT